MGQVVIQYTTGEPGAGKSYLRCGRFIVEEILNPATRVADRIWCNYPLKFEQWVDRSGVEREGLLSLASRRFGMSEEEVRDRVRVFPETVVKSWGKRGGGPWEFFGNREEDLSGCHIAIDEIHNWCPKGGALEVSKPWRDWLGEIRHEGCTVEFLTQSPRNVNSAIENVAGVRCHISRNEERRDPAFNIRLGDWWNLWTVFGRRYRQSSYYQVKKEEGERFQFVDGYTFFFDGQYFGVYDSNSASHATGRAGSRAREPWERFGRFGVIRWFLLRNWWRFFIARPVWVLAMSVAFILAINNFDKIAKGLLPVAGLSTGGAVADKKEVLPAGGDNVALAIAQPMELLEKVEDEKPTIKPVAIGKGWFVDASGQLCRAGDAIGGSIVAWVDYERREVRLVGGQVVSCVPRGWVQNASVFGTGSSAVAAIPGSAGGSSENSGASGIFGSGKPRGGAMEPGEPRPLVGQGKGPFDSGGGRAGR